MAPSAWIDLPQSVRKNLNITFASVEERALQSELEFPGVVVAPEEAFSTHSAPVNGRASFVVGIGDSVQEGQKLGEFYPYHLPELRSAIIDTAMLVNDAEANVARLELQAKELADRRKLLELVSGAAGALQYRRSSAKAALEDEEELRKEQIRQLEELNKAGGGMATQIADARAAMASTHSAIREAEAEVAESELEIARIKVEIRDLEGEISLNAQELASARTGLQLVQGRHLNALLECSKALFTDISTLTELDASGVPGWQRVDRGALMASQAGVITERVSDGTLVEEGQPLLQLRVSRRMVVQFSLPQSGANTLSAGMMAHVSPASGAGINSALNATLRGGVVQDSSARGMVTRYAAMADAHEAPTWWQPGALVAVRVVTEQSSPTSTVIPADCLIQDGLELVYFLRDPENPDRVMRQVADVGMRTPHFVELKSGVMAGYEVVLQGVYELKLSRQGAAAAGGHFHADGTWHPEAH